ncbi:hypothetical protein AgCh_040122 [Apium graveolens]
MAAGSKGITAFIIDKGMVGYAFCTFFMHFSMCTSTGALPRNLKKEAHERIAFVDIPDLDESTLTELIFLPMISFFTSLIERQQTLACLAQQSPPICGKIA